MSRPLAEPVQQSLSEWKPGDGRHTFSAAFPDAGWNLAATFDKAESLGGAAWEIALQRTGEAPEGCTLKGWAERTANQMSGLLESLRVYEVDSSEGIALLRSDGPQARGSARAYYELVLNGTSTATLKRFQSDIAPGSKRQQVPFAITYEALGQVVEAIAG
jgi:hypothetical protein